MTMVSIDFRHETQVCQESVNMTFNQNFDCQCEFNSIGCISTKTAMENWKTYELIYLIQ